MTFESKIGSARLLQSTRKAQALKIRKNILWKTLRCGLLICFAFPAGECMANLIGVRFKQLKLGVNPVDSVFLFMPWNN